MRVVFFDTESTDLTASWGHILCASFCDLMPLGTVSTKAPDAAPRTFKLSRRAAASADDSKLVVKVRDEIEKADMVVSWNGIFHDIPLLNARLAVAGHRLTVVPRHLDLYHYVSGRGGGHGLKIGSRSMDSAAKFFGTGYQKTGLDGKVWQLAAAGQMEALDKVVEHCEADVQVLRELFPHLAPQVKKFTFPLAQVWKVLVEIPG